jgi:hypothetical protein
LRKRDNGLLSQVSRSGSEDSRNHEVLDGDDVSASFASKRTEILQDSERQLIKSGDFTNYLGTGFRAKVVGEMAIFHQPSFTPVDLV